jgi:hypothetical protein
MSQKLKTLFYISIPLFVAHGLEEIFNGFYNVDWSTKLVFGFLYEMPVPQATFWVFQIMLWLALIIFALLISSEKWRLRLMFIPGIIFIVELHHLWSAITSWSYYPGLVTSIPVLIIGFLFWKELLNNSKKHEV